MTARSRESQGESAAAFGRLVNHASRVTLMCVAASVERCDEQV